MFIVLEKTYFCGISINKLISSCFCCLFKNKIFDFFGIDLKTF